VLSITNLVCGTPAGNEALRYGHVRRPRAEGGGPRASGAGDAPRPVVVWAVTKACNLRCVHCYASASPGPAPGELSFDEGVALLDDLRRFGVPAVLFSGGEPLVRPDLLRLIDYAQFIGLNCTLSTNGVSLDDAKADALAEVGLRYVGISLDGAPAKHDRLRGRRGAFAQSVAAIDRCRARGIKVGVRFTVSGLNLSDLDAVFDVCLEREVQRLCVYHLAYAGRGERLQDADLTARQTRAVVDRVVRRTREAAAAGRALEVLTVGNHADAGYLLLKLEAEAPHRRAEVEALLRGTGGNRSGCNVASIDPVGGVHYDQFSWHYACGNVREKPFSEIWSGAADGRLRVLRDRAAHLPARCRGCRFLEVCNGNLRTRAEAATGDWLGPDPGCYLADEEIAPVQGCGV
jgi:radical SAM protein with 4Fe4S-binding SPASM domain